MQTTVWKGLGLATWQLLAALLLSKAKETPTVRSLIDLEVLISMLWLTEKNTTVYFVTCRSSRKNVGFKLSWIQLVTGNTSLSVKWMPVHSNCFTSVSITLPLRCLCLLHQLFFVLFCSVVSTVLPVLPSLPEDIDQRQQSLFLLWLCNGRRFLCAVVQPSI